MKFFFFIILVFSPLAFAEKRIISLSPAITEMIFALKLEKALVGVSEYSDFPEEAQKIPTVGPYTKPNIEKILSLKPDLVLVPAEGPEDVMARLNRLRINSEVISIRHLSEIGQSAVQISKKLDASNAGLEFKKSWDQDLKKLFAETPKVKIPFMIVLQTEPSIVAASNTFLDEIGSRCGGSNVFSGLTGYPKISQESLIGKNIKLVLIVEHFSRQSEKEDVAQQWRRKFQKLGSSPPQIEPIDPNTAARPGPRLLKGIEKICQIMKNHH